MHHRFVFPGGKSSISATYDSCSSHRADELLNVVLNPLNVSQLLKSEVDRKPKASRNRTITRRTHSNDSSLSCVWRVEVMIR